MTAQTELAGSALSRLREWLAPLVGGCGPLRADLITGGRSNVTYRVSDGANHVVVRRPPGSGPIGAAHDVGREFRVVDALQSTTVPVPPAIGYCDDSDVIGAPFAVTGWVDGTCYRDVGDLSELEPAEVSRRADGLIDTLAAIHSLDVSAGPLSSMGRPRGYLERQVLRWCGTLRGWVPSAVLDSLELSLTSALPAESRVALLHGDYRLDNLLIAADGTVAAVVDWEMATVGDPMTDVALLIAYQELAEQIAGDIVPTASTAPGYPGPEQVLGRYEAAGGQVRNLAFHESLAATKIAGIITGIAERRDTGATLDERTDGLERLIEPLVAKARQALNAPGRDRQEQRSSSSSA